MTENKFNNPAATVDIIIEKDNGILLVKRKRDPFKNQWVLPGGFLDCGKESLEETAARELREETSLSTRKEDLVLFGVYSDPNRDPRGHIISHVYIAKKFNGIPEAGDDAKEVRFFPLEDIPELAFDHNKILRDYFKNRNL